jgi:hypothetical protein
MRYLNYKLAVAGPFQLPPIHFAVFGTVINNQNAVWWVHRPLHYVFGRITTSNHQTLSRWTASKKPGKSTGFVT